MSGSLGLDSTPLTDAERTDVRRFCGYPAYGAGASGFSSWRFFTQYGELEFRLTNLSPAEFQVVRQYLASLYTFEAAIPNASSTLIVDTAAVFIRNKNEMPERNSALDSWGRRLCAFLGVPPGPKLSRSGGSIVV